MGYIYKIINLETNKYYLGSTKEINKRTLKHFNELRKNKHHCIHLQRAFNKYGEDNFKLEIILECENYKDKEQELLDSISFKELYNVSKSASGGDLISNHPNKVNIIKKAIENLKNAPKPEPRHGNKNPNWRGGKTFCECGNRIGSSAKICIDCQDRSGDNNPFFNKTHSDETKNLLSELRKGKYNGNQEKIVIVNDVEFKSLSKCAKHYNVKPATILNRIKSKNFPEYRYK
jgi:group I intron endonuclease